MGQYLRNEKVVKEFTAYYDLYNKYKKDYHIEDILSGNPSVQAIARAKEAAFDERLSLLGMLLDKVQADMKDIMEQAAFLSDLKNPLKGIGSTAAEMRLEQVLSQLEKQAEGRKKLLENLQTANTLSDSDRKKHCSVIRFLEESRKELYTGEAGSGAAAYDFLKMRYTARVEKMKQRTARVQQELHALFSFAEEAFGTKDGASGNEMLILVTELTVNSYSARFIATFGSPDYKRHNEELMLTERSDDIRAQIAELDLG